MNQTTPKRDFVIWALGGVLAPLGKICKLFSSLCSDFIVCKLGFHVNLLHKAVVPVLSAIARSGRTKCWLLISVKPLHGVFVG